MKVALTGGGTLGHVIPALAVARAIQKEVEGNVRFVFVGSRSEKERRAVEEAGIRFVSIPSGKLRRYFSLRNFTDLFRIAAGFFSSLAVLGREKPDVLFSKGGFVSVPVVAAAWMRGVPVVTHESDCTLGLANRINAKFAKVVCMGFDGPLCGKGKFVFTGNPVRPEFSEARDIEIEDDLVLVLGGSMGAVEVNKLVYADLDKLCPKWRVVHQCGANGDFSKTAPGYTQTEFIGKELPSLMAMARVVVSRAGANSIAEMAELGKVMLLVPLRAGSRGDQVENAERLEKAGAAFVLREGQGLCDALRPLMEDAKILQSAPARAREVSRPGAAGEIARITAQEALK